MQVAFSSAGSSPCLNLFWVQSVNRVVSPESAVFRRQLCGPLASEHNDDTRRFLDCNVST